LRLTQRPDLPGALASSVVIGICPLNHAPEPPTELSRS
jgi:hypothetical protein